MRIPFTSLEIRRNAPETRQSKMPYAVQSFGGLFSAILPRPDFAAFFQAYEKNGDVQAGIRELRQTVGLGGWRLLKGEDEAPQAATDELNAVLNFRSSFRALRERTMRDCGVTGNEYWYLIPNQSSSRILGVVPLDPRTVSIVSDAHGEVKAYIQRVGMGTVVFTPAEIIHFKTDTDTVNEMFGMSPLMAVDIDIKADIEAATTNLMLMKNNALPAAMYILRDDIKGQEQIDIAIKAIKDQFTGGKNAGKSAVLPDVKEIKTISPDYTKLQFLEMRRFTTEKFCSALGVPKFLLGYTDTVNNNNGTELMRQFYAGTVQPWEKLIAETITRELLPRLGGEGFTFEFLPQEIDMAGLEKRALEEFKTGTITLRQYKQKTGQDITPEDEQNPNFDAYIIHAGGSARLLEDVGVEPVDTTSPEAQENLLNLFDRA